MSVGAKEKLQQDLVSVLAEKLQQDFVSVLAEKKQQDLVSVLTEQQPDQVSVWAEKETDLGSVRAMCSQHEMLV